MKHIYLFITIAFMSAIPSFASAQSIREKTEMLQHQADSLQSRLDSLENISKLEKQVETLQSEIDRLESIGQEVYYASVHGALKGRKVIGEFPRATYSGKESGTVVVTIWVDPYGNVSKAQAGADGTTVTSPELWNAARESAMKTHFNQKADAPALQQGTITYIYALK